MSDDDKKTFQEKVDKAKDNAQIKKEETILKANEKKANAKLKIKEKKLERKQAMSERKVEAHLNLAEIRIDEALEDADIEIAFLSENVDLDIANEVAPIDLILFKATNILEEIFLRTQLRIQVAKNELIANLQEDLKDAIELVEIEESISGLKEKTDHVIGTLEGKIASEKEELNEKYGDE